MKYDLRPFDDRSGHGFFVCTPVVRDRSSAVSASDGVDLGYESANPSLQDALWSDAIYGLLNRLDRR